MTDSELGRILSDRRDEAVTAWRGVLAEHAVTLDEAATGPAIDAICRLLEDDSDQLFRDVARLSPFGDGESVRPGAVISLVTFEIAIASLCDDQPEPELGLTDLVVKLGKVISDELALNESKLRDLASTDTLTGAMSRQAILSSLDSEIARAVRHGRPLSVVYVDVDLLKRVNDTGGHMAGDRLLKSVVDTMRASARSSDMIGRMGGDEFLLVLPDTPISGAEIVATRLAAVTADAGHSVSAGVAGSPVHELERDSLVGHADHALMRAKRSSGGAGRAAS